MTAKPKKEELIVYMKGKLYHFTEEQIKTGGKPLDPGSTAASAAAALLKRGVLVANIQNPEPFGEFTALLNLDAVISVPTPK
jgi:hypothetical protein